MCFRPIRLSNIRLPIGIMLSRLIIYHDNLADWTFSLLSHMLMSNNSLTTRRIGHYKQLIQQKVQSFQISQQFWTFYLILLLVRSNPPHFLTQFGLSHASSPLQRPIRHTTAPPHITLHLPIHGTKVFRENEVRRLYNLFSNRCEDTGT